MKKQIIKIFTLFLIAIIGWIFWVKKEIVKADKQDKSEKPYFQNNIIIHGIVDSVSDSGDHCFGIIYLKKFKSNIAKFTTYKKNIFPYAIENNEAEIYSWTCLYNVKNGDSVILNSNKRSILIIKKDSSENIEGNLSFVDSEKNYIQENSKLHLK